MVSLNVLTAANAGRCANAKLTRKSEATKVATRLVASAAKERYRRVEAQTGVPWAVIAVIHERESSQNWAASLAQGDPWNRLSVHIPAGRGPFKSWEDAAIDALVNCAPHLARHTDWSLAGTLTALETYNGVGYAAKGVPSPYIWSGTDQYRSGKYVRDGVYNPNRVDAQLGCAALLLAMTSLDSSITFASAKPAASGANSVSSPSITNPSKGSIGAFVAGLLTAIFKRR